MQQVLREQRNLLRIVQNMAEAIEELVALIDSHSTDQNDSEEEL